VENDDVERLVLERECAPVALHEREVRKAPPELSPPFDEDRRRIDPDHVTDTRT
jgi:hypothetical protein